VAVTNDDDVVTADDVASVEVEVVGVLVGRTVVTLNSGLGVEGVDDLGLEVE